MKRFRLKPSKRRVIKALARVLKKAARARPSMGRGRGR